MTSFASSSGCSHGDEAAWRSGADSAVDASPCDAATPPVTTAKNLWFYSTTRQQLAPQGTTAAAAANISAASYGVAAMALRQRTRPVTADAANLVRFEVVPSAVLNASVGKMRTEAGSRATRVRQRSHVLPNAANEALRSARTSLHVTDGAAAAQDAVSRLTNALNECDALQGQQQQQHSQQQPPPTSPRRRSLLLSHNTSYSGGSAVLQPPTQPPSEQRGRRRAAKNPFPSHVVDLTRSWVAAERAEAAAAAAPQKDDSVSSFTTVKMPAFHAVHAHAAPLATPSCVMRLHKSKFDLLPHPSAETSLTNLSGAASTRRAVRPASASALEARLLAEPIHSYRILKDATTPFLDLHPSSRIPLLEASQRRRVNLERLTHNFEHQRYVLHGELEDALEWRGQCQAAVLRRRSNSDVSSITAEEGATTAALSSSSLHRPPTASRQPSTDEVYQGLLDDVFAHHTFRGAKAARVAPARSASIGFRSAWTKEAVRQALDLEKAQLTRLLRAYNSDCGAAALTLADVEDFRAETIKRVWHPEDYASSRGSAVYYREHFLAYVQSRYPVNLPTLSTVGGARLPSDILDALPSKAEASFAKFVYETLPRLTADA